MSSSKEREKRDRSASIEEDREKWSRVREKVNDSPETEVCNTNMHPFPHLMHAKQALTHHPTILPPTLPWVQMKVHVMIFLLYFLPLTADLLYIYFVYKRHPLHQSISCLPKGHCHSKTVLYGLLVIHRQLRNKCPSVQSKQGPSNSWIMYNILVDSQCLDQPAWFV